MEEENENLQLENANLKDNLKQLKKERAENMEKIEGLNKRLLNAPAPVVIPAPLPVTSNKEV